MTHQIIVMLGRIAFVVMAGAFTSALCGHWDYLPWKKRRSATTPPDSQP